MSEIVQYSLESNVAQITLNRPEALNALNGALLQQLTKNVTDATNDQNVRALIITGTGRAFSSGGDLRGVGTDDPLDPLKNAEQLRRYEEISLLLSEMPKPTIAAINGVAAGAGFSIALATDFRIASEEAKFLTAFAKAGLTGDFGGTWLLERIVGTTKAKELYLLGNTISATAFAKKLPDLLQQAYFYFAPTMPSDDMWTHRHDTKFFDAVRCSSIPFFICEKDANKNGMEHLGFKTYSGFNLSNESLDNPVERWVKLLEDNKELFTDLKMSKEMYHQNKDVIKFNLNRLMNTDWFDFFQQQFDILPDSIQNVLEKNFNELKKASTK